MSEGIPAGPSSARPFLTRRDIVKSILTMLGLSAFATPLAASAGRDTGDVPAASPARSTAATRIFPSGIPIDGAGLNDLSSAVAFELPNGKQIIGFGTTRRNESGPTTTHDRKGRVVLMRPDGTVFQNIEHRNGMPVQSSIAVGNLHGGSNALHLLFGFSADVSEQDAQNNIKLPGGVACYEYSTGLDQFALLWEFAPKDVFPGPSGDSFPDPVVSTPCLVDVDGDGNLEVFFGAWDNRFYLLDSTGAKRWEFDNTSRIWSSGVAADVNNDGFPEIICGSDVLSIPGGAPAASGGAVTCFDKAGAVLWRNYYDQSIYSSPALADVDGDGYLEVVVGTSDAIKGTNGAVRGNYVLCLNAATGAEKWRFTTNGYGFASPAIANFLQKTNPLTGLETHQAVIPSGIFGGFEEKTNDSRVYVIDSDGTQVWSVRPKDDQGKTDFMRGSPLIVDYDGDGLLEVLQPLIWGTAVINIHGVQVDYLKTDRSIFSSPVVVDGDGDGTLELYQASANVLDPQGSGSRAWFYGFKLGATKSAARPWPMFRRDPLEGAFVGGGILRRTMYSVPGGKTTLVLQSSCPKSPGMSFTYVATLDGVSTVSATASHAPAAVPPNYITVTKLTNVIGATLTDILKVEIDGQKMLTAGVTTATFTIVLTPGVASALLVPRRFELTAVLLGHSGSGGMSFLPGVSVQRQLG